MRERERKRENVSRDHRYGKSTSNLITLEATATTPALTMNFSARLNTIIARVASRQRSRNADNSDDMVTTLVLSRNDSG